MLVLSLEVFEKNGEEFHRVRNISTLIQLHGLFSKHYICHPTHPALEKGQNYQQSLNFTQYEVIQTVLTNELLIPQLNLNVYAIKQLIIFILFNAIDAVVHMRSPGETTLLCPCSSHRQRNLSLEKR